MNRTDMIAALSFREEGMWLQKLPTRFVTVGGTEALYSDAELALLVEFTERKQAAYHARCGNAKFDWADNFISFERDEGRWGRKRLSWREGRMHSASLPEAIATFWSDQYRDEMLGDFCLLESGEIVEVLANIPYTERDERGGDFQCRRVRDGADCAIKRYDRMVMSARSIEALGDQMRMAMRHRIDMQQHRAAAQTGANVERDMAIASITDSNDATALLLMWENRVMDFWELQARGQERVAA